MKLEKIQNTAPKMPELVMKALLKAMENGQLRIGDDLPSERDLSELLGVGRGSLRETLAVLEFLGVIVTRGNRKAVLRDANHVRNAMSFLRLSDDPATLADFLEFRRINETKIARMACERATQKDIDALSDALTKLEKDPQDNAAHRDFHENLALAGHNVILSVVMDMVNTMMTELRQRNSSKPGYMPCTLEDHREILNAIIDHDADRAEAALFRHLDNIAEFCDQ
ncbi:MAG: FadR/GntR family transcriptional regulator [Oscillospiraceae bacterium]